MAGVRDSETQSQGSHGSHAADRGRVQELLCAFGQDLQGLVGEVVDVAAAQGRAIVLQRSLIESLEGAVHELRLATADRPATQPEADFSAIREGIDALVRQGDSGRSGQEAALRIQFAEVQALVLAALMLDGDRGSGAAATATPEAEAGPAITVSPPAPDGGLPATVPELQEALAGERATHARLAQQQERELHTARAMLRQQQLARQREHTELQALSHVVLHSSPGSTFPSRPESPMPSPGRRSGLADASAADSFVFGTPGGGPLAFSSPFRPSQATTGEARRRASMSPPDTLGWEAAWELQRSATAANATAADLSECVTELEVENEDLRSRLANTSARAADLERHLHELQDASRDFGHVTLSDPDSVAAKQAAELVQLRAARRDSSQRMTQLLGRLDALQAQVEQTTGAGQKLIHRSDSVASRMDSLSRQLRRRSNSLSALDALNRTPESTAELPRSAGASPAAVDPPAPPAGAVPRGGASFTTWLPGTQREQPGTTTPRGAGDAGAQGDSLAGAGLLDALEAQFQKMRSAGSGHAAGGPVGSGLAAGGALGLSVLASAAVHESHTAVAASTGASPVRPAGASPQHSPVMAAGRIEGALLHEALQARAAKATASPAAGSTRAEPAVTLGSSSHELEDAQGRLAALAAQHAGVCAELAERVEEIEQLQRQPRGEQARPDLEARLVDLQGRLTTVQEREAASARRAAEAEAGAEKVRLELEALAREHTKATEALATAARREEGLHHHAQRAAAGEEAAASQRAAEAEDEARQSQETIRHLREEAGNVERELATLSRHLEAAEKQHDASTVELEHREDRIAGLLQDLEAAAAESLTLQAQLATTAAALRAATSTARALEQEKQRLEARAAQGLEVDASARATLEARLGEAAVELEASRREVAELQETSRQTAPQSSQLATLTAELEASRHQAVELQEGSKHQDATAASVAAQLATTTAELEASRHQVVKLKEAAARLQTSSAALAANRDAGTAALTKELATAKAAAAALEIEVSDARSARRSDLETLASKEGANTQLKAALRAANARADEQAALAETKAVACDKVKGQLAARLKAVAELEASLKKTKQAMEGLRADSRQRSAKTTELQSTVDDLRQSLQSGSAELDALRAKWNRGQADHQAAVTILERTVRDLRAEMRDSALVHTARNSYASTVSVDEDGSSSLGEPHSPASLRPSPIGKSSIPDAADGVLRRRKPPVLAAAGCQTDEESDEALERALLLLRRYRRCYSALLLVLGLLLILCLALYAWQSACGRYHSGRCNLGRAGIVLKRICPRDPSFY